MDKTTYDRLEFPAVLEYAAQFAESAAAKENLRNTEPWTEPERIRHHWDAVSEILNMLDSGGDLPIGGFEDCDVEMAHLRPLNGVLEPAEWLRLRNLISMGADVRRQLSNGRERMRVCWTEAEGIDPLEALSKEIGHIFDADGYVRDSASPELRNIRQKIKRLEREIEHVFEKILSKMQNEDVLRDAYITTRNGRRVVPVRSSARGRLPGLVHDVSNTGETVFVEPLEAVEPTNRLSEEQNREREEIFRILSELARTARENMPALENNRRILLQLDLWRARARLANRYGLHRPQIEPGSPVDLIDVHHPLLYFRDKKKSIPLSMRLEPRNKVLVITGPNTGGKTTCLKTIGLVALMAQSAIPVPLWTDSKLPVFGQVLAEMGDEQSVSAGLSTFSAHIRRISWILEHCGRNALVLLDELGKATDPAQAGALGRAILEALVQRGALTLVTTHLGTLKDWAHESPAARNASYRLDPESHRPQYQLHMDTPGISEAFTIAEAEGLPPHIVQAAIDHLPKEEREMSDLLQALHEKELELVEAREEADETRAAAERERDDWQKKKAELDLKRTEMDRRLEHEYKELLDKARKDIEVRIANLPSRQAISQARQELERDQRAAKTRLESLEKRERKILESAGSVKKLGQEAYEPSEGDWVAIGKTGQEGPIKQVDAAKKRARVQVGAFQIEAGFKDLRPATAPPNLDMSKSPSYRFTTGHVVKSVPVEIDLHGWRVEDALDKVDKYLDEASLSHVSEVRIVHGHGTGALRSALHDFFRRHPHVKSFRLGDLREGGAAVTFVTVK